jgi:hypothetical protein
MSLLTATAVDCTVPRGTTKTLRFQINDLNAEAVYNLTGHTVKLLLSTNRVSENSILTITGNITNPTQGWVEFDFAEADTESLMVRSYDADIIVTETSSGDRWTAFRGSIAVTPTIREETEEDE